MEWVRVCGEGDVADGDIVPHDEGGRRIMLVRMGDAVYAADRTCTHEDADMGMGFASAEGVRCPLHLSVFDLATGRPLNPPAHDPITTYNVKIENGGVWVEI